MIACNVIGPRGQRMAAAVLGTLTVLVLAACGAAASSAPGARSTRTVTTPLTALSTPVAASPADLARQRATVAYLGMWQDFAAAGTTSDWQSPALAQHATGIALTNMSRGLYADHYNHLVTKGTATHDPHVSSVDPPADPTKVTISDCSDSRHYLKYDDRTGQPAPDSPGGRQSITAIVEKQANGVWRVSDFGVHGVGSC